LKEHSVFSFLGSIILLGLRDPEDMTMTLKKFLVIVYFLHFYLFLYFYSSFLFIIITIITYYSSLFILGPFQKFCV
jgi:hypothetical protein